jgi:hypothetical protein
MSSKVGLRKFAGQDAACPSPAVIASRLSELLLGFPAAAAGGVQWQVLARTYKERYGAPLDLSALGHSSPLAAVSALLWDVLRVVDREDMDNPVLGIEDGVALIPQPGLLACWPSLYQAVCEAVRKHGFLEAEAGQGGASCLLLSNLRPLLERTWHPNFDEGTLGFRNEEGRFVKLKKMKHLLIAVLQWRGQRLAWQASQGSGRRSPLDDILASSLTLIPSKRHNDLMLRCSSGSEALESQGLLLEKTLDAVSSGKYSGALKREVGRVREQSSDLQAKSEQLQRGHEEIAPWSPFPQLAADIFDDPFEPPPEASKWCGTSESGLSRVSTVDFDDLDSRFTYSGGSVSNFTSSWHSSCHSAVASGMASPALAPAELYAFVPMWMPINQVMQSSACFGDVSVIPNGIVEAARQQFERVGGQMT